MPLIMTIETGRALKNAVRGNPEFRQWPDDAFEYIADYYNHYSEPIEFYPDEILNTWQVVDGDMLDRLMLDYEREDDFLEDYELADLGYNRYLIAYREDL